MGEEYGRLTSPGTPPDAVATRRAVVGWVLYDTANVVFVMNILSLYFPLWVVEDAGGQDADYGLASGLSMAAVFVAAPFLGTLSDRVPRRLPFLVVSTIVCCALTFFLGTGGLAVSLVLFALANTVFQSGLVFYDALLPVVSTERTRGRISGYGIGAGFGGSLLGVGLGLVVLGLDPDGKPLVFRLTALLFLLGALPCFLWLHEPPRPDTAHLGRDVARRTLADLRGTLARARRYPGLMRFLVGRACYSDATNTLVVFMGIYATQEVGFSDLQTQLVLLVGILAGPLGALGCGAAVDRIGPKRTLNGLLCLWASTLTLAAAIPALGLPSALFWVIAPLVGIALGGTPTADRAYLLRLAPPRRIGHYVGLYAMVGRFAAILSPLLWAAVVDGLGWGRPAAVLTLVAVVGLAYAVLAPVDDAPRAWAPADLVLEAAPV